MSLLASIFVAVMERARPRAQHPPAGLVRWIGLQPVRFAAGCAQGRALSEEREA